MARFQVCLQRYVEETVTVEVEAATPKEAVNMAYELDRKGIETWWPAEDVKDTEVYAVLDEADELVWER